MAFFSDECGLRLSPVIRKPIQTKTATSIVARVGMVLQHRGVDPAVAWTGRRAGGYSFVACISHLTIGTFMRPFRSVAPFLLLIETHLRHQGAHCALFSIYIYIYCIKLVLRRASCPLSCFAVSGHRLSLRIAIGVVG